MIFRVLRFGGLVCLLGMLSSTLVAWTCAIAPTPFISESRLSDQHARRIVGAYFDTERLEIRETGRSRHVGRTTSFVAVTGENGRQMSVRRDATGWPARMLFSDTTNDSMIGWTTYEHSVVIGSVPFDIVTVLPIGLHVTGFVLDTLAWAAVWVVVLVLFSRFYRTYRNKRHLRCPNCKYDLQATSVCCSECGVRHPLRNLLREHT